MLVQLPMKIVTSAIATAGLGLVLAACGPNATTSPGSAEAPTAAPAANVAPTLSAAPTAARVATDASAPTAASAPTTAAQSIQTGTAARSPTQPPATSAAAQPSTASAGATTGVKLVIDSSASQASYHAREQLVGKTLPSDAVGTSKAVSGSLLLTSDGTVLRDQSQITVDLTKLQSDESRRDNFIKSDTLQTSRFPTATFVASEVQGLPLPLPTSGEATFQLVGDLTVHGVTKPVTWQVTAQFDDTAISGTATTSVNITDFGMSPPKVGPVLSIQDGLNLDLAFTAARG